MKHIILVGFKSVGKSTVGRQLAKHLDLPFIDSDFAIADLHAAMTGKKSSCREIMREQGADYFRALETEALQKVLSVNPPVVIAVGGGAPMSACNQTLLKNHTVVHITAPKGAVFERIMLNGRPAFFPADVDPYSSFQKIWSERNPIYEKLATLTVENGRSLDETVANLAVKIHL